MSSRARWRGDTTGPRAESEYAVEPVGVATMSPSAAYVVNGAPSMRTIRRTVWPDSWRSITASLSARHVQGGTSPTGSAMTESIIRCSISYSPAP